MVMAEGFLSSSPLFSPSLMERRILQDTLARSLITGIPVMVVSAVCPPYTTDDSGRPTYAGLNSGIECNIRRHLDEVPKGVNFLNVCGIKTVHFFLMADTEVGLTPFLAGIGLSEEEFTRRCQLSVEAISQEVRSLYPEVHYESLGIPPAARFLSFFGNGSWYDTYESFRPKLLTELAEQPFGRVARGLLRDAESRSRIITALLENVDQKAKIEHIIRQKAQYMAFACLLRSRFEGRLIIVNHKTPNFEWMNDRLVRVHSDQNQTRMGNYLPKLPLLQLNISTEPGGGDD